MRRAFALLAVLGASAACRSPSGGSGPAQDVAAQHGAAAQQNGAAQRSGDAAPVVEPGGPDCKGFGGRIHGESECVTVDLRTGALSPLDVRPWRQAGVVAAECDHEQTVGAYRVRVVCEERPPAPDAGMGSRPVTVSIEVRASDAGAPRRIRLANDFVGFWDFVNVWFLPKGDTVDIAIDYGVLD